MKSCNHSHWLGLDLHDNEVTFSHSDRAHALLHDLPYFESQKPSLLVLIGNRSKALALRELAPGSFKTKSTGKRAHGEIHLFINPSGTFSDRPVLVADGDFPLLQKPGELHPTRKCHEVNRKIISLFRDEVSDSLLKKVVDSLYYRLLSPFTDVFCFFADDLGGLRPIARRILTWTRMARPSTLPTSILPRILIITSDPEARDSHFFELLPVGTDLSSYFGRVEVLNLFPEGDISTESRHRKLKENLMDRSDEVHAARADSRCLFSAEHFAAFLKRACSQFGDSFKKPFNFISASRLDNPPAPDLKEHLINFLVKIEDPDEQLQSFAAPLIASSLLLDSYPPDMHLFSPTDIFRTIYKDTCSQACREGLFAHQGLLLPSPFLKLVEEAFAKCFDNLTRHRGNSAVDLHRQLLLRLKSDWLTLQSKDTCLVCLRRRPQYDLPCGHCICLTCVRAFGRLSRVNQWDFEVDSCFFCGAATPGVVVKTLPKTAGVRILTFDGGGVRGLITLEDMQQLQDEVGLPYPVQENFDMVFGTSSGRILPVSQAVADSIPGGIIVLALCVNGWSAELCIERFERLAILAFQPRPSSNIPFFSPVLDLILSYFADGRYSADNLEAALQDAFGRERGILDCSKATATGTYIGLPVTTIRETSTCIFTNYNGVGVRSQECGYHILRQQDGLGRVLLWEIARCGSAAPSYFKPKHISGQGTFQDGGLGHDPCSLALQEAAVVFPFNEPSLVVSLGTGSPRLNEEPHMSRTRGILRDGFIPRLYRAFMRSLNSTDGHKFRSRQRKGRKEQYFRFDIEFNGPEPGLDDTTKMQELKTAAREAIHGSESLNRLAKCIRAELFVFELDHIPRRGDTHWVGDILCRWGANEPPLAALLERLEKSSAKFLLQGHPLHGSIKDGSYLDDKGNFRKRVSFEIHDRRSPISIQLREDPSDLCSISGSPYSIETLVAQQQLEYCFGRSDHVKRKRVDSTDALNRKRRCL